MGTEKNNQPAVSAEDTRPYKQLALNVGANFAQSIASETFKQTIFSNAAGIAAIIAYLSNNKNIENPIPLALSAACFLLGVGMSLLALMLTYTHSSSLLKKMLSTAVKGTPYNPNKLDKATGFFGAFFCWLGVIFFVAGAISSGYGFYLEFADEIFK